MGGVRTRLRRRVRGDREGKERSVNEMQRRKSRGTRKRKRGEVRMKGKG